MKIKDFPEKMIRDKLIKKLKPQIKSGRKHDKGLIFIDSLDQYVTRFKLPNSHKKLMRHSKSQYIAEALKLNSEEFNSLIECPMRGQNYYQILLGRIKEK